MGRRGRTSCHVSIMAAGVRGARVNMVGLFCWSGWAGGWRRGLYGTFLDLC